MRLIFNIMFVAQLYSTKHLRGYVNHTVTPTATLALTNYYHKASSRGKQKHL